MKNTLYRLSACLAAGFLVSWPKVAMAGPICEGSSCALLFVLAVVYWVGTYVVPPAFFLIGGLTLVFRYANKRFNWGWSSRRMTLMVILGALLLAYPTGWAVVSGLHYWASRNFQKWEEKELFAKQFPVYELGYVPAGYRREGTEVQFDELKYEFFNRAPGEDKSSVQKRFEINQMERVRVDEINGNCVFDDRRSPRPCVRVSKGPGKTWFAMTEPHQTSRHTKVFQGWVYKENTTLVIKFTDLSHDEITQIFDNLREVPKSEIKFSDSYRKGWRGDLL